MRLIKFFTLIIFLLAANQTICAAEKNPVRIACLPIILQRGTPDEETVAALEMKMARATNIPLNKTLQVAEYISSEDSTAALNKIWQRLRSENKKAKISDAVKILAKDLDADLVICPILRRYYEETIPAFGSSLETHLSSDVSAEMIVYDRRTDELADKKTSKSFHDSYNTLGRASYLAGECLDNLIIATKLREKIRAISK